MHQQFDDKASQWLEFSYADGQRKGLASERLAGLQHFMPACQGKIWQDEASAEACQSLAGSRAASTSATAQPSNPAGNAILAGINLSFVAAGLLICFDGMMRSGELYHLQVGNVTFYH